MSSTRELRRRIRSIKNTSQITKAMEMVAATKMRRAQLQAMSARPYNQTLNQILHNFLSTGNLTHPLLLPSDSAKTAVTLISTNKSLCGALNTNLFRLIQRDLMTNTDFFTIGSKGRNFAVKTNKPLIADFENTEHIELSQVRQIRKTLVDEFLNGHYHQVRLIFSNFVNTLIQQPVNFKLLPIDLTNFLNFLNASKPDNSQNNHLEYIYEPNLNRLLEFSLIHYLDVTIYQALLESKASEHSARMIAMQNASNNAEDLVEDLQLTYNQTRQESITKELLEITSASAALE